MTLARFTPSILDGEALEHLFVQRHHLLDDVMSAVGDAATGDERRHKLFVGPRGAGKTHLISLVNHRVRQTHAEGLRVGLSWLMEDPWDIETYDDLLDQILEKLSGGRPDGDGEHAIHAVVAANGPIVVLVENLDQILTAIGADGQRRLRALLENDRPLLLIATSTRLSEDLLSQAEPFYGFFDEIQLEPFSVEQAHDMLRHVADYAGDESLATLLRSPQAAPRLATIAHLAGGQPRVWALLGAGLSNTGIDDMVDMLLARFDDLTPYYQEQLARLSPSERKAVRRLADADRPLTVRDLAGLAKTDQRSMSKTVSDLRRRGWIRKHESILTAKLDARLSYYELAEPLARIAFQMKAARGEPVRLVVDFLSLWFGDELRQGIGEQSAGYRRAALEQDGAVRHLLRVLSRKAVTAPKEPNLLALLRQVDQALASFATTSDPSLLLQLPAPVCQLISRLLTETSMDSIRLSVCEVALKQGGGAGWRAPAESLVGSSDSGARAKALALLIWAECADSDELPAAVPELLDQLDDALMTTSFVDSFTALLPLMGAVISLKTGRQFAYGVLRLSRLADEPFADVRATLAVGSVQLLLGEGDSRAALALADHELAIARRSGNMNAIQMTLLARVHAQVKANDADGAATTVAEIRGTDPFPLLAETLDVIARSL